MRNLDPGFSDQAVVGPHDEDAAYPPAPAGLVDQDGATVDEGRLHRLAEDLDDAALAGGQAVASEPLVTERDRAGSR